MRHRETAADQTQQVGMHLHNHEEIAHQVELVIDGVGIIIGADLRGDGRGDELERARLRRGRKSSRLG